MQYFKNGGGGKIKQVWNKEKWSENEKMCSDVFCVCMLHCGLLDVFRAGARSGADVRLSGPG